MDSNFGSPNTSGIYLNTQVSAKQNHNNSILSNNLFKKILKTSIPSIPKRKITISNLRAWKAAELQD
jgi:hypothetical protein